MKFFTKKLWNKVNNASEENQLEIEEEWFRNCSLYAEFFEKVKKLLPEQFLREYLNIGDFHDFGIMGIEILKCKSRLVPFVDLKLNILGRDKRYTIYYESISHLNIDSNFMSNDIRYLANRESIIDNWGYDEFDISDNSLVHEILFLSGSTLRVQFNNIAIFEEKLTQVRKTN